MSNPNPGGMKPNPESELEQFKEGYDDCLKALALVTGMCGAVVNAPEADVQTRRFAAGMLSKLSEVSTVAAAMIETVKDLDLEDV